MRDNDLSCFQKVSCPDIEKIKKKVNKILKVSNLGRTKFLNFTFDLKSGT